MRAITRGRGYFVVSGLVLNRRAAVIVKNKCSKISFVVSMSGAFNRMAAQTTGVAICY